MDEITFSEGVEFINTLVAAGFTPAHAQKGTASPELASQIVSLCDPGPATPVSSTSLAQAKAIMGGNFRDPAKWASQCGFRLSRAHKATFGRVPFSVELLKLVATTHILVPVLPLSIMQLHGKFTQLFYQKDGAWYTTEAFATEKAEVGWMLFRREVAPGSTNRSWADQQALIPEGEQAPSASQLVQGLICHAALTDERLLPSLYARTSSVDSDGDRVDVGGFDADGLDLSLWSDDANSNVGVVGARKLN